jgi:anti-sigma B factor antagonist
MDIKARRVDEISCLDIAGPMRYGEGGQLLEVVKTLLDAGQRKFLLDLSACNYIDSSGLGMLATTYTSVRKQGGDLQLVNLSWRVRHLLEVTRISTIIRINDTAAEAVQSLNMGRFAKSDHEMNLGLR